MPMSRKPHINIPTDILRTVVVISDVGSFSKAGQKLGLTQPAITSQIKRLQTIIGAPLFNKTAGGVALSDTGRLMLPLIRRMLETNDQILHVGGSKPGQSQIRLGVPNVFCQQILQGFDQVRLKDVHFHFDNSTELARRMASGYLDICILKRPASGIGEIVHTWRESAIWVRGREFTLNPGQPIPLIGRPGYVADQIAVRALEAKNTSYRFAFDSIDLECRTAAAAANIGLFVVPRWAIPAPLIQAKDCYLPPIPDVEVGLLIRHGADASSLRWAIDAVMATIPTSQRSDRTAGCNNSSAYDTGYHAIIG
jgi:DNA-binding transcriptional LysR family regulator